MIHPISLNYLYRTTETMTVSQDATAYENKNTEPVISVNIKLTESTIVNILKLLLFVSVSVGIGVEIGSNNATLSPPLPAGSATHR